MIMVWFCGYLLVQIFTEGKGEAANLLWTELYFLTIAAQAILRGLFGGDS